METIDILLYVFEVILIKTRGPKALPFVSAAAALKECSLLLA